MFSKPRIVFTELLQKFLAGGFSLSYSLKKISEMKNISACVKEAAFEINCMMESGSTFSIALLSCTKIVFPQDYVNFVSASISSSNESKVFNYLLNREQQKKEYRTSFWMNMIYPLVVVICCIAGSFFLVANVDKLVPVFAVDWDPVLFKQKAMKDCILANLILFLLISVLFVFVKKNILGKPDFELFSMLQFLLGSGKDLYSAFEVALVFFEKNKALNQKIKKSLLILENGQGVEDSIYALGEEYACCFEIGVCNGKLEDGFNKVSMMLKVKAEKIRSMIEKLMEPAMMMILASYIIFLLVEIVMPVLYMFDF